MITKWKYIADPEITIVKLWLTQTVGGCVPYDKEGNPITGVEGLLIVLMDSLLREMRKTQHEGEMPSSDV